MWIELSAPRWLLLLPACGGLLYLIWRRRPGKGVKARLSLGLHGAVAALLALALAGVSVSGGAFNHEVQSDYCAIGYVPAEKDATTGKYGVKAAEGNAYYTDASGKTVYGTLTDLLNSSATKNTVITLLTNVEDAGNIVLFNDRTIDLNGKTLGAEYLIGAFGQVKDSSNGKGLLKIAAASTTLAADNGQVPIYDSVSGGYRLFTCSAMPSKVTKEGDAVKVLFAPKFTNADAYKLLKNGNAHNITVEVALTWKNGADADGSQTFNFVQAFVDKVASSVKPSTGNPTQAFSIKLTGLDSSMAGAITEVKAQCRITSGTNAVFAGGLLNLT